MLHRRGECFIQLWVLFSTSRSEFGGQCFLTLKSEVKANLVCSQVGTKDVQRQRHKRSSSDRLTRGVTGRYQVHPSADLDSLGFVIVSRLVGVLCGQDARFPQNEHMNLLHMSRYFGAHPTTSIPPDHRLIGIGWQRSIWISPPRRIVDSGQASDRELCSPSREKPCPFLRRHPILPRYTEPTLGHRASPNLRRDPQVHTDLTLY